MKTLNVGIALDEATDYSLTIGVYGICGAVDLTGYAFLGQMRTSTDPTSDAVAEFQFQIQDQFHNRGRVMMSLPASVTGAIITSVSTALRKNRLTTPFVFDVLMKDTAGKISRIVQGNVYVSPPATQESF